LYVVAVCELLLLLLLLYECWPIVCVMVAAAVEGKNATAQGTDQHFSLSTLGSASAFPQRAA
jgi:hypothetical protein